MISYPRHHPLIDGMIHTNAFGYPRKTATVLSSLWTSMTSGKWAFHIWLWTSTDSSHLIVLNIQRPMVFGCNPLNQPQLVPMTEGNRHNPKYRTEERFETGMQRCFKNITNSGPGLLATKPMVPSKKFYFGSHRDSALRPNADKDLIHLPLTGDVDEALNTGLHWRFWKECFQLAMKLVDPEIALCSPQLRNTETLVNTNNPCLAQIGGLPYSPGTMLQRVK